MTLLPLLRPIVVTAVGHSAYQAAGLVAEWLDDQPLVRINVLDSAGAAHASGRINIVQRADGLKAEAEATLRRALAGEADFFHWIVMAGVVGPDAAQSRDDLQHSVLQVAAALAEAGRPFTLSLLLIDASQERVSPATSYLANLAAQVYEAGIHTQTQVYVLRGLLQNGFALQPAELTQAAALACEALVLSNLPGGDEAAAIIRPASTAAQIVGNDTDQLQIFGRLAVLSVRSLEHEIATSCAGSRLYEFGMQQTNPGARVELHWTPPITGVQRPQLGSDANDRIGAALRGGAQARFSGPPDLWADPNREFERLEQEAESWVNSLTDWQRTVRRDFSSVVRELRDASARERDFARLELDGHAAALWSNLAVAAPLPYLRDWADRQERSFSEDATARHTGADGLRMTNLADARRELERPFLRMRYELGRRPNNTLLLCFAALTLLGGAVLLWTMLGELAELTARLSWLGDALANQMVLLRVLLLGVLVAAVAGAVIYTFWEVRIRWARAYNDLESSTNRVATRERNALARELALVDSHWHVKTIATVARHMGKLNRRINRIDFLLRRTPRPRTPPVRHSGRLVRYVPAPHATGGTDTSDGCELLPAADVAALLRAPQAAERWVSGDVERWTRDERALLYATTLDRRRTAHATTQTELRAALESAVEEWRQSSRQYVVLPERLYSVSAQEHWLAFGAGDLGRLAYSGLLEAGELQFVPFQHERDELLLVRAQMGLTPEAAAQ